ncbi:MAG: universal stress protein, partial [Proteobacteria bacterium]|nr:universal stress protein [Pseudomonadota bacterium]
MQIDRILVANDSYNGLERALSKVALIEHITGASVEVATVVYDSVDEQPIPEHEKARLIEAFMAAERAGFVGILKPFEDKIAWADPRVLWGKRAETAIIKEAGLRKVDLIVKPMAESAGISDLLHTPLDWRLIRSSPVPVLMSKSEGWKKGDDVLVAVDASDKK